MAAYLLRRLLQIAVVVVLVTTAAFVLIHLAPGDPFSSAVADPRVSEAVRAHWREAYGLDKPLPQQFVSYIASVARGDLGWSIALQRPVIDVLRDALPNTLLLMSVAIAASFALGIAIALAQARRAGSAADRIIGGVSLFFFSLPEFWLALMVLGVAAYAFPRFPIGGMVDPISHESMSSFGRALDVARHMILPALTLTLVFSAVVARYQRAALLDVLPAEYIRTARAKGLSEREIIRSHALRNALLPIVTLLGLAIPALLTGAVFVEKIFSWPGMGLVIVNSIDTRDYALLISSVIAGSVLVAFGSLLADILYRVCDPRLRDAR